MSFRRRFATLTSAAAAALVGVLFIATPAYAEGEVEVEINGLSDSVRAGSFDDFRAVFSNASDDPISGVYAVVTVSFPGAAAGSIQVQRFGAHLPAEEVGDGTFAFTDPAPFDLGRGNNGRRRVDYFLSFGGDVPEGEAALTVAAYAGGELLGSADASIQVRGGTGATTPPNTNPGFVPTFTPGATYSVAPLPEAAAPPGGSTNVPAGVYVLGALLASMGVVTLLLILFPPGRRSALAAVAPAGESGPHPPGWVGPAQAVGGPAYPRPPHPGALGPGTPAQWPAVAPPPGRRPGPARDPRPRPSSGRVSDHGPYPAPTRAVRDPRPEDPRWHYE